MRSVRSWRTVIRIPHQLRLNRLGRTSVSIKLPIQSMQKEVGQQRRDHSTLRGSLLGLRRFISTLAITFDNRAFQPLSNQGQNTPVGNTAFQTMPER
jgi:hypothetical protein